MNDEIALYDTFEGLSAYINFPRTSGVQGQCSRYHLGPIEGARVGTGGAWETPSWQPRFDLEHTQTGFIARVDRVLVFLPPLPDISRAFFERGTTTPPSPLGTVRVGGTGGQPVGKGGWGRSGTLENPPPPPPSPSPIEERKRPGDLDGLRTFWPTRSEGTRNPRDPTDAAEDEAEGSTSSAADGLRTGAWGVPGTA